MLLILDLLLSFCYVLFLLVFIAELWVVDPLPRRGKCAAPRMM